MEIPFLELKSQYQAIREEIEQVIGSVFNSGRFVGGESVRAFESAFANKCGVKYAISCGNATDGLFMAMKSMGIGKGDEVLVPAMTWISDSAMVSLCGAKPVFVDVEEDFFCIHPKDMASKITKKTKAVLIVHLYGQTAQMDELRELTHLQQIGIIEDCAQAHFAEFDGKKAGSFGQTGVFSFYPSKTMGAYGDAGCVITQHSDMADFIRKFANHGAEHKNDHLFEGINSRMDSLQAAVLLVKMNHIDRWIAKKNVIAQWYKEQLQEVADISLPQIRSKARHTFHIFAIRCKQRDELKEFLAKNGIQTEIHYPKALPFLKPYHHLKHKESDFPIAARLEKELLSLPIYPELTRSQVSYLCDKIKLFYLG